MDADCQKEIYALIKRLNTERKITLVSVEHNLMAAVSNSTLIYHLSAGNGHVCTPEQYAQEYLNISQKEHHHHA